MSSLPRCNSAAYGPRHCASWSPRGECLKTFNAASGTPLARLRHKERFYQQGECLLKA